MVMAANMNPNFLMAGVFGGKRKMPIIPLTANIMSAKKMLFACLAFRTEKKSKISGRPLE